MKFIYNKCNFVILSLYIKVFYYIYKVMFYVIIDLINYILIILRKKGLFYICDE